MKLLLTSGGITNKKIADALLELVGKKAEEIRIAFIPTAVNASPNDMGWYIDDLYRIKQQKYKSINLVDISALPRNVWQPRLEKADVLIFSGGVTAHLVYCVRESGLKELLPELLKNKVYVGISAGTIMMSKTLAFDSPRKVERYKKDFNREEKEGLGLIDFYIRPHLNSTTSPHVTNEWVEEIAKTISQPVYGIDDQMALKVVDRKVEVVGEGEYIVFNQ
jgi:dipeptidase E